MASPAPFTLSRFGEKFSRQSGIVGLMDDLGRAMTAGSNTLMLGGGNPAHIPFVEQYFNSRMREILDTPGEFARLVGNYDGPQGEERFLDALAELFSRECGWPVTRDNIAITNGSQSAFFSLFNMFAGDMPDGGKRRILFPLAPEYIGYGDIGLSEDMFVANAPAIELIGSGTFKYHVDFADLVVGPDIGAICVSRPTNPTGNVLTDDEVNRLLDLAGEHGIPLIIDNAYGTPFPNIIFTEATAIYDPRSILCMSLSKLGLPGARCGIVVAEPGVIRALSSINAITNLSIGSFGPGLALEMIRSGEVVELARRHIRPFYQARAQQAITYLHDILAGYPLRIHAAEGAIFLWLWFKGLPISSVELYQRLKHAGVLVIAGEYFFPGLNADLAHTRECIRVTYAQDWAVVQPGLDRIAAEVKAVYDAGPSAP